jgi:hypothetical protein
VHLCSESCVLLSIRAFLTRHSSTSRAAVISPSELDFPSVSPFGLDFDSQHPISVYPTRPGPMLLYCCAGTRGRDELIHCIDRTEKSLIWRPKIEFDLARLSTPTRLRSRSKGQGDNFLPNGTLVDPEAAWTNFATVWRLGSSQTTLLDRLTVISR